MAADQPQRGGTLRRSTTQVPASLDAHLSVSGGDDFSYFVYIYDNLLTYDDKDASPKPNLAERWEVSPDGLTYTFKLRSGVKFHDNTDFNAAAVKYDIDRIMAKETGARFREGSLAQRMESWTALDPTTFQVKLNSPWAPFLSTAFSKVFAAMSPTQLEKLGKDFATEPVGTGKFKLKRYQPGATFEVERYPGYWATNLPYLDAVTTRIIPDANTAWAEFQAGSLDLGGPPSGARDKASLDRLRRDSNLQVMTDLGQTWVHVFWHINQEPFKDVRARQAFSAAIDRRAIHDTVMDGLGAVSKSTISLASWALNPSKDYYNNGARDVKKAKDLLAAAGMPNGFKFKMIAFNFDPMPKIGEAMQAQLKEAGMDMELVTGDIAGMVAQVKASNYNAALFSYESPYDPVNMFGPLPEENGVPYSVGEPNRWPNPASAEFIRMNGLRKKAIEVSNQGERQKLYWDTQELINEQMWNAGIIQFGSLLVANKKVGGIYLKPADGSSNPAIAWLQR